MLPIAEKNRLAHSALPGMKTDIFKYWTLLKLPFTIYPFLKMYSRTFFDFFTWVVRYDLSMLTTRTVMSAYVHH